MSSFVKRQGTCFDNKEHKEIKIPRVLTYRAGHGSGRGGYGLFFKPALPYAGLDFLTRDPPKMPRIRAGFGSAGRVKSVRVLRVCGYCGSGFSDGNFGNFINLLGLSLFC
jgi:hypothetical protein